MFGYPVADDALDATTRSRRRRRRAAPSGARRRDAAADPASCCRDRDWYLTEIAQQLELSKPTIKHHLALLRAAGLVTVIEEGSVIYYSLRRDRLDDASGDLKRFLARATRPGHSPAWPRPTAAPRRATS